MLATKTNADMSALIQVKYSQIIFLIEPKYLEATDPFSLNTSHLTTAHYLLNLFINSAIQNNKPTNIYNPGQNINPFLSSAMLSSTNMQKTNTLPRTIPETGNHQMAFPSSIPTSANTFNATTSSTVAFPVASSPTIKSHLAMFRPVTKSFSDPTSEIDFTTVPFDAFEMLEVLGNRFLNWVLTKLGTGTFGKVRLCRYKDTKKHFCMKILNKARIVRLKQTEHIQNERDVLKKVRISVEHYLLY
jgi:hypothetical protein